MKFVPVRSSESQVQLVSAIFEKEMSMSIEVYAVFPLLHFNIRKNMFIKSTMDLTEP